MTNQSDQALPFSRALAVTGNSGSGKSLVLKKLAGLGAIPFSADAFVRELLLSDLDTQREIVAFFPDALGNADGQKQPPNAGEALQLDRSVLRNAISSSSQNRERLEAILHPRVKKLFSDAYFAALRKSPTVIIAYEIPLLFEVYKDGAHPFGKALLITAEKGVLEKRICERDKLTLSDATARLNMQRPREETEPMADYIIQNSGSTAELESGVEQLWPRIKADFEAAASLPLQKG